MAKKAANSSGPNPRAAMAGKLKSMIEKGTAEDIGVHLLPDATTGLIGLPIPFPLQYALAVSALPLGIVIEINGAQMSCKSMFVFEFGRLFADFGGWLDYIVTEGKISTDLARSVIGWSDDRRLAFNPFLLGSMSEWQAALQQRVADAKNIYEQGDTDSNTPPGGFAPGLFAVDSIMGANMAETNDKIEKQGHAGRGFAVEALSLTTFLKKVQADVCNTPFIALFVNHLKQAEVDPSNPYAPRQESRPGGKQLRFQETFELRLNRIDKQTALDKSTNGGLEIQRRHIQMKVQKNSIGTDGRSINVWVSWRFKTVNNKPYQITKWHWDEATTKLLLDYQAGKNTGVKVVEATAREHLDRHFHFRRKGNADLYWSDSLDIPSSNPVTGAKLGQLINSSPNVLAALRSAFGISTIEEWVPGQSFKDCLEAVRNEKSADWQAVIEAIRQEALQDTASEDL